MVDLNLRKSLEIRSIQPVIRELESVRLRIGGFHPPHRGNECETPPATPPPFTPSFLNRALHVNTGVSGSSYSLSGAAGEHKSFLLGAHFLTGSVSEKQLPDVKSACVVLGVQRGPIGGFGKKTSRFCPQDYYELDKKHPYGGGPLVSSQECPDSPEYHTAQGAAWGPLPHKRTQKGWVSFDDVTKHARGTSVGKHMSMMAPDTLKPENVLRLRDMGIPTPNEERLQELYNLHQKKAWTVPGPGAYEVNDWKMNPSRSDFRRPHDPETDGPFFLQHEWEDSTRDKELTTLFKTKSDSGLGPGHYEAPASKDWTMQRRPGAVVERTRRSGKLKLLMWPSISRNIMHGCEWRMGINRDTAPADFDVEQAKACVEKRKSSDNAVSAAVLRLHSSGTYPGRQLAKEIPPPPGFERAHKSWGWIGLADNQRSNWTHKYGGAYRCGQRTDKGIPRANQHRTQQAS